MEKSEVLLVVLVASAPLFLGFYDTGDLWQVLFAVHSGQPVVKFNEVSWTNSTTIKLNFKNNRGWASVGDYNDIIFYAEKYETSIADPYWAREKNTNLWNIFLKYRNISLDDVEWGYYENCCDHGRCERGVCYICEPNICRGEEYAKDETGCPLYRRKIEAGYYCCMVGGGSWRWWECWATEPYERWIPNPGECQLVRRGSGCELYDNGRKMYCNGRWYYTENEATVYKYIPEHYEYCGGANEKYGKLKPSDAEKLISLGWKWDWDKRCVGSRCGTFITSSIYYGENMKKEWLEEILNKAVCWVEGRTLRYRGNDISHPYKIYGEPVVSGNFIACKVKRSDWNEGTKYGNRPYADKVLYDTTVYIVFDAKCDEGWLDAVRCEYSTVKRQYRYSNCTVVWKDFKNCDEMDGYYGERYCRGNNLYQKYRDYYCDVNADGFCSYYEFEKLVERCYFGCENGRCKKPVAPEPPKFLFIQIIMNIIKSLGVSLG